MGPWFTGKEMGGNVKEREILWSPRLGFFLDEKKPSSDNLFGFLALVLKAF